MEKTLLRFFLRRHIRSYLYTPGGGAAPGPEGPQRRRHFGTFPETRFCCWEFCQLLLSHGVAGQDECDRSCAGHGGRGAALQRAAPQQLAVDHE